MRMGSDVGVGSTPSSEFTCEIQSTTVATEQTQHHQMNRVNHSEREIEVQNRREHTRKYDLLLLSL